MEKRPGSAIPPSVIMCGQCRGEDHRLLYLGENSKIGAGSVVLSEVPPNCTVVGIPGRVVRQENVRVPRASMDHIHLPDPVRDDLKTLQRENSELVNRVLELEKEMRCLQRTEKEKEKNNEIL